MNTKLKIGLDIHGIIDSQPKLFSYITKSLKKDNHEIHIITGSHINQEIIDELKSYEVVWDELFSISDYHKEFGTKMWYDENENPWIDDEDWDRTKGEYCKRNNINLHIDDTERYGKYFETKFIYINLKEIKIPIEIVEYRNISNQKDLEDWIKEIFHISF
jgi:hypothetical protein